MSRGDRRRRAALAAALALTALLPSGGAQFEVHGYGLVSTRRLSRTLFENTYSAYVSNWGEQDASVTSSLASLPAHVTAVDGALDFGFVAQGDTVEGGDTFVIRHDRIAPLDGDALLWSIQALPAALTTYELIDQALDDARIDAETALVYKVFADFDDPRLPASLRGRDDDVADGRALEEAERRFASLAPANQALLAPFLMRPDEPGSWVEVQAANSAPLSGAVRGASGTVAAPASIGWAHIPVVISGVEKALVWWMTTGPRASADAQVADAIANEMELYLWEKLTGAFSEPVGDDVVQTANGTQPNPRAHGPDGLLDIYLTGLRKKSLARPASDGCDGSPGGSYILLNVAPTLNTVAHEFMHAIVASQPLAECISEYHWLNEATATWAEHFAYDGRNGVMDTEHKEAPKYLRQPLTRPWDQTVLAQSGRCRRLDPTTPDTGEPLYLDEVSCGGHQYGAYLWFLNLTQGKRDSAADAAPVKLTWAAASGLGAIDAINAVKGGFQTNWPTFLANNWNRLAEEGGPHRDYVTWDRLETQAYEQYGGPIPVRLGPYFLALSPIFHQLPALSAQYDHYDFSKDPKIRQIWYYNDYAGSSAGSGPRADVRAIIKLQGQWHAAVDWSADETHVFCRDDPAQDIQELVLIISNLDVAGAASGSGAKLGDADTQNNSPLRLVYSPVPCHDWVGSVSFHTVNLSENGDSITSTATANNVRFHFDAANSDPLSNGGIASFEVVQGDVDWHIEDAFSGCSIGQFANSFPAAGTLRVMPTGISLTYQLVNGAAGNSAEDTIGCSGGPVMYSESFSEWVPSFSVYPLTDIDRIEGHEDVGNYPGDGWTWSFAKP